MPPKPECGILLSTVLWDTRESWAQYRENRDADDDGRRGADGRDSLSAASSDSSSWFAPLKAISCVELELLLLLLLLFCDTSSIGAKELPSPKKSANSSAKVSLDMISGIGAKACAEGTDDVGETGAVTVVDGFDVIAFGIIIRRDVETTGFESAP